MSKSKRTTDPLAVFGLTEPERKALHDWMGTPGTESVDGVWDFVGRDADAGCEPPAGSALQKAALLRALMARAHQENEERQGLRGKGRLRRVLTRHWLEVAALLLFLAVAAAAVRVIGAQQQWWEAGLVPTVIAAKPLDPGRDISDDDVITAYFPRSPGWPAGGI